jgi:hypothetical protein
MTMQRAFRVTFLATAVLTVAGMFLPLSGVIAMSLSGYALLAVFGFWAGRSGATYGKVFFATWPFVALWFGAGLLNFLLGRGETPPGWPPQMDRQAFYGYIFATVLFLPVAFACSGLGMWVARLVSKHTGRSKAA